MKSSKVELKRARPALGTVIMMRLQVEEDADMVFAEEVLTDSFSLVERLEQNFSKFQELSDICRLNKVSVGREIPVSVEFLRLAPLAMEIYRLSQAGFNPFGKSTQTLLEEPLRLEQVHGQCYARKLVECELDFSGIAKGFIVDELCGFLSQRLATTSGIVNAGGDLRFFNSAEPQVEIRLGTATALSRQLTLEPPHESVATSTFKEATSDPLSTTEYSLSPRAGLNAECTVTVLAKSCAVADALTKVGWFAAPPVAQKCAERFGARILVFNEAGALNGESPFP